MTPSLIEYAEEGFEWTRFKIEGDCCIMNLSTAEGQWGRVIVWDYVQDKIIHLTSAPFVQCSTLFNGQVVSLYCVAYWGHPADLWYSAEPLERNDPAYEAELHPLSLSAEHIKSPGQFDICIQGKMRICSSS